MPNDIEKLYALQQIDLQRLRIIKDVKRSLAEVQEPPDLADLRAKYASLREEQEGLRNNQTSAEAQVATIKDKIAANQDMLESGRLTDPKEIAALQAIIVELEGSKSSLEERALAALLEFEDKQKVVQPLRAKLEEQDSQWQSLKDDFGKKQSTLAKEMKVLNAERKTQAASMNAAALAMYEDLLKRKNGIAVTTISDSSCDACFMSLPTSVATAPRDNGSAYLHCPSCGRILVQR